jgi:cytochrome c biogenesis protein CcmG/thiol:disulfide interchange protein DsbE
MKTDRIIEAGLAVTFLAFCGAVFFALHDNVVKVGDKAPEFSIKADNGKTITAHDFGGKLLILNFWASWCEPCVQEAPSMQNLATVLGPSGLVVLGISEDEDPKAYKGFLDRFRVTYPTARDPSKEIRNRYGTVQIPESYLIDAKGRVVEKIVSSTNWSSPQMIEHVQSLL